MTQHKPLSHLRACFARGVCSNDGSTGSLVLPPFGRRKYATSAEPADAESSAAAAAAGTPRIPKTPASATLKRIRFYPPNGQPKAPPIQTSRNGKLIQLIAPRSQGQPIRVGGRRFDFDPIFLRDACQKKFDTSEIPTLIQVRRVSTSTDGTISLSWQKDIERYPTDHVTKFSAAFIKQLANTVARIPAPGVAPETWNNIKMQQSINFLDYEEYMTQDKTLWTALRDLHRYGLVFVKNVPEKETSVEAIGERIGPLRNTFYGWTWDVKDKPRAENVAYTSGHLGLHMDLMYMKNPPGLQLLHCLQSSSTGGKSIFSDALHAARLLEKSSPAAFQDLATFPVTYAYQKGGNYYADSKPTFQMSPHEHVLGNPRRFRSIDFINFSPPFQGPLHYDPGEADHGRRVVSYLRAIKAFQSVLEHEKSVYEHRLAPGECVIFDNRRVVHGRTAFDSGTGERWLKGAYLDTDVLESRFAALNRTLPAGQRIPPRLEFGSADVAALTAANLGAPVPDLAAEPSPAAIEEVEEQLFDDGVGEEVEESVLDGVVEDEELRA